MPCVATSKRVKSTHRAAPLHSRTGHRRLRLPRDWSGDELVPQAARVGLIRSRDRLEATCDSPSHHRRASTTSRCPGTTHCASARLQGFWTMSGPSRDHTRWDARGLTADRRGGVRSKPKVTTGRIERGSYWGSSLRFRPDPSTAPIPRHPRDRSEPPDPELRRVQFTYGGPFSCLPVWRFGDDENTS